VLVPRRGKHQPSSRIHHWLKTLQQVQLNAGESGISVIQPRQNDWRTGLGTDRRTLRSWRRTAKQAEMVFVTCDIIETSKSMYIPRSRTTEAGVTSSVPTRSNNCGSWWERRLVVDHRISVFAVFNWSLLERIHLATSSTQLVMVFWSSSDADGRQNP